MEQNTNYPFCAIVGQEDMKRALILNVINPRIGGVLIRGEKGTAKSTAVRSLADILPERRQAAGCRFSCDPDDASFWCGDCRVNEDVVATGGRMRVVNLPVSATEDRVVGTLDIEFALKKGEKRFEPGILALANRNILYVDEVNLLEDHVVDVLLDAAAMGVNMVEREGVSYSHPSNFVLVGSMNPEEGDLRPQLIDRFGLVVDVCGEDEVEKRAQIIRYRLDFERNPDAFSEKFTQEQISLGEQISKAKKRLGGVMYSDACLEAVAELVVELGVDGHRADITLVKTAMTNAAFMGRGTVTKEDLFVASKLALPHRMRRKPFEEGVIDLESVYEIIGSFSGI